MYRLLSLLLVTVSALVSGCAMCSTPYDCHYAAYGGSHPRGDRVYGRVGSAFNDASATVEAEVIEGEVIPGEVVPDAIFEGEVLEGDIIEGEVIEGEISGEISGDIIEGQINDGEIILDEIIQDGGFIDNSTNPFTPSQSDVVELPSVDSSIPPAYEPPAIDADAVNPAMDFPRQAPNLDVSPGAEESALQLVPDGSPSPAPLNQNVQPAIERTIESVIESPLEAVPGDVMPDVGGLMNGLPVPTGEATIEVLPAVIDY